MTADYLQMLTLGWRNSLIMSKTQQQMFLQVALNQDCNLKSLCQFIYTLEQTCASKIGMTI